jgi:hypothetical protein
MSDVSDQNKAAVVRFWNEVLNGQNFAIVPEIIGPDYKFNGVPGTPDGVEAWVKSLHTSMPNMLFIIEQVLAETTTVGILWRLLPDQSAPDKYIRGGNFIVFEGGKAISNDQAGGLPQDITSG